MAVITIYDVAREAGVSISTVSNALNRPHKVGPGTRERVLETADRLGYVPKPEAAVLARRSIRRVAVFAPFTSYDSYLRRLSGVLQGAHAAGTEVAVFDIASAAQVASPVLSSIPLQARFDGLIVMGIALDPVVEQRLVDRDVPVVVVDAPSDRFPALVVDDRRAGALAAEHLVGLGHRRISYLSQQVSAVEGLPEAFRESGYTAAMTAHGLRPDVVGTTWSQQGGADAARRLLRRRHRPTAVHGGADVAALGLLDLLRGRGLAVPGDVSVAGCDNTPVAAMAPIGMTSVEQDALGMGRRAARLLVERIGARQPGRHFLHPPSLVVRGTTGAPPHG